MFSIWVFPPFKEPLKTGIQFLKVPLFRNMQRLEQQAIYHFSFFMPPTDLIFISKLWRATLYALFTRNLCVIYAQNSIYALCFSSIDLIWPIAFVGLSPLGHTLTQFMIP